MRRRLALVAAVAVLGGLALAGCQRDPDGRRPRRRRGDHPDQVDADVQRLGAGGDRGGEPGDRSRSRRPRRRPAITRADVVKYAGAWQALRQPLRAKADFRVAEITPRADRRAGRRRRRFAVRQAGRRQTESCLSGAVATASPATADRRRGPRHLPPGQGGRRSWRSRSSEVKDGISAASEVQQCIGRQARRWTGSSAPASIELNPRYRPV